MNVYLRFCCYQRIYPILRNALVSITWGLFNDLQLHLFIWTCAGKGLYDNIKELNLPRPEALFDVAFFQNNPEPFYKMANELLPGSCFPTTSHYFMTLLNNKGRLRRVYTQNVDNLEQAAGVPKDKVIQAHGSFDSARCCNTKCVKRSYRYSASWIRKKVKNRTC